MARIFVSHSGRDTEQAARLAEWLRGAGFSFFLDADKVAGLSPGSSWERQIYRQISDADAVLLLLTTNWSDSKWCFAEFTQARALGKVIIPLVEAPAGERLISSDIQSVDLTHDRADGLERLALKLTRIAIDTRGGFHWDGTRPPFPGLMPFQELDAAIYFGRDDDTRLVIERLNAHRIQGGSDLVVLLGASGSGKSSLMRAGVLPRLNRDKQNWIVLRPFRPQAHPLEEFAQAIAATLESSTDWREWHRRLSAENTHRALADLVGDLRVKQGANEGWVLISIDQAEELFSTSVKAEAESLFKVLNSALVDNLPLVVFLGLRSDYLGHLQMADEFGVPFEHISLKRMPPERKRQIIEGPARIADISIDEALIASVLMDAATEDALPLLAFVMRDLYERFASSGRFTVEAYRALGDTKAGLSPIANAVRRRADEVLAELQPSASEQEALKEAFVAGLARVDPEGKYIRCPMRFSDIPLQAQAIIERLVKARLLVMSQNNGVTYVEVAHEALLREWPLLRGWLDADHEFLISEPRLGEDHRRWLDAPENQKSDALLFGLRLKQAEDWLKTKPNRVKGLEQFIRASATRARQKERLFRSLQTVSFAATIVFIVATAVALWQWRRAEQGVVAAIQIANTLVLDASDSFQDLGLPVAAVARVLDRAIQGYDQVLKVDRWSTAILSGRGLARAFKGEYERATADLNQAIKLDPQSPYAYAGLGFVYLSTRDYNRSIAEYGKAIALDPKSAANYSNRGIVYIALGYYHRDIADYAGAIANFEHAIDDYKAAIKLDPNLANAHNGLGNARLARGDTYMDQAMYDQALADYNDAIGSYDEAIRLNSKFAGALFNRGNGYRSRADYNAGMRNYDLAMSDYDAAIKNYDAAILLNPRFLGAYDNRGLVYIATGDYDRAIADYDQALNVDPSDAVAYDQRGVAYRSKGDIDRAIADFDHAIRLKPDFASAYGNRGNAFGDRGELDSAIADYSKAIELAPRSALSYNNRGYIYNRQEEYVRAITDYDSALRINPGLTIAYNNRGMAYYNKGDFSEAANALVGTNERRPDATRMLYRYLARSRLGEFASASEELQLDATLLKSKYWPAAVVDFFLERQSLEGTFALMDRPSRMCTAYFFVGEWYLVHGNHAEAMANLRSAASACPKGQGEYVSVLAELKRLSR